MNLRGTLVPSYTLNSLLGNIPILGMLLTGGEGEGVFALTYRVRGSVESPTVSVNPLSVLAPGFLRRFVTAFEGGEPPIPAGEGDADPGRFPAPQAPETETPADIP